MSVLGERDWIRMKDAWREALSGSRSCPFPKLQGSPLGFVHGAASPLMFCPIYFPLQRAKIAQGSKTPEEKTTNTISKFENNGNRDRMKLTDFNFLMVLGKGSFGKVGMVVNGAAPARLRLTASMVLIAQRGERQGVVDRSC